MGSKGGNNAYLNGFFKSKRDKVLIPNPGYPTYQSVTRLVEAEPIFYDLNAQNQWQPNFDDLDQMDLSDVKLMWVNYLICPQGANHQKDTYEKLIPWAKKKTSYWSTTTLTVLF